jgi:hypothetical protein
MSCAFINVPSICELIENIKENDPNLSDEFCKDFAAISWNLATYIGESIGPIMGGYITLKSNFTSTCLSTSAINFTYFIIYFIFVKGKIFDFLFDNNEEGKLYNYSAIKDDKNSSIGSLESFIVAKKKPFIKKANFYK